MPTLTTALRKVRTSGPNPTRKESGWLNWALGSTSLTGATVNDESALSLAAFYRGVTLIAAACAGQPIQIFQEDDNGESERIKTPATAYLWSKPNPEMSRFTFWERVFADEVRGNAFIWVEKDELGAPVALWWLARGRVKVGRLESGRKVYEVDGETPMIDYSEGGEIIHIPNWGDSLVGYDIVKLASQAIALGLSAEEYAARSFGDGQIPPGILTSDAVLTPKQAQEMSDRWHARHSGTSRSQKIAVLGAGATFQAISRDLEEMQVLGLREFQSGDIATLLGLAPHLLGLTNKSTSWGSGIAEQGQATVTYTLNAHTTRVKQAIDDNLLVRALTGRYVEFDPGGFLRGSILQQYQAHSIAYGRFVTVNEIRKDLNLPPVAGGDVLLAPVNMAPLSALESMEMESAQRAAPPDLPAE